MMKSTIMLDEVAFNYNKLWQFICYNVRQMLWLLWLTETIIDIIDKILRAITN